MTRDMTQPAGLRDADEAAAADRRGAYPELSGEQVDVLVQAGTTRTVEAGDVLFRAGDSTYSLTLVLAGSVAIVDGVGTPEQRTVVEHGPGGLIGELNLLTGQAVFLTAVATRDGEVVEISPPALRRLLEHEPTLSDILLRALLLRRAILLGSSVGPRVLGSRFSADTRRLLEFLARARVPSSWLDLETDAGAERVLAAAGVEPDQTPVVLLPDRELLRNPSNARLAAAIGLGRDRADAAPEQSPADIWDMLVVGTGPAGLAACVYGASEGLRTLGVDAVAVGGQAGTSSRIENYLGFPAGLSGSDLAARAAVQAEKFGARLAYPCQAAAIRTDGTMHVVTLIGGDQLTARAVVLATGARYRRPALPDLERYEGTGVYYAATHAEATRCAGRPVVVVGGGNSAGQAAVFLASRAEHVHMLIRRDDLSGTMSRYLIRQIEQHPRISVHAGTELHGLHGDAGLERVTVRSDTASLDLDATAVFVFIGAEANTAWLAGHVALDAAGFVLTGNDLPGDGHPPLMTSRPGVFAAGDVRTGSTKRVAAAVGEGSMSVGLVHRHLAATFAAL